MHTIQAKSILSSRNGMNLYRGCQHGCIYCDSRSKCYHMEHAFEDIEVKENALLLLEDALRRKRRKCMIGTGAMTDPYLPLERELLYTRRAEEIIERYGFGFTCQTKSNLILRDLDLLKRIHEKAKCVVQMTLTTCDEALCKKIEPNVSTTRERFDALLQFREAGIPTVVWISPILPFLNDTEENIAGLVELCRQAGVYGIICFGMGMTLREGNREYYYRQLDRLFPGLKERYIKVYGNAYEVASPRQDRLMALLTKRCDEAGIVHDNDAVFSYLSSFPEEEENRQISLWDGFGIIG